jgi:hypothetical protein
MTTGIPTPPAERSRGRAFLWLGILAGLIGLPLIFLQFELKSLFVPWYSPVLATLGAALIFLAITRRTTILRVAALVLVGAFAGLQWYFLASLMKLPDYTGPAQKGKQHPAFTATFADGSPFTEADLHDGSRRVMVFFRGRW